MKSLQQKLCLCAWKKREESGEAEESYKYLYATAAK
jgi:hypothetical protein